MDGDAKLADEMRLVTAGGKPARCPCQVGPTRRRSRKYPGHYADCKKARSGELDTPAKKEEP
jgi:hypothetical protein